MVWFYPPLFYSIFHFVLNLCLDDGFNPFLTPNVLFFRFSSFKIKRPFNNNFLNVLVYICCFSIDILISSIMIYIFIPFMAIKAGAFVAWTGKDDPDREITKGFKMLLKAKHIPVLKLYENLG